MPTQMGESHRIPPLDEEFQAIKDWRERENILAFTRNVPSKQLSNSKMSDLKNTYKQHQKDSTACIYIFTHVYIYVKIVKEQESGQHRRGWKEEREEENDVVIFQLNKEVQDQPWLHNELAASLGCMRLSGEKKLTEQRMYNFNHTKIKLFKIHEL